MQTILTPEDCKRVADALIEKIEDSDFGIAESVREVVRDVLMPSSSFTGRGWVSDWLPLTIEQMCDEISRGVVGAVQDASERNR